MTSKETGWFREVARDTQINVLQVGVGTASPAQILGPNPKRKAIIFTPSTSTTYTCGWQPNVTSGQGLTFSVGTNPYMLSDKDIGTAITLPLFAIANSTGRTVTIYEVVYVDSGDNRFTSEHVS